jgi:hypothetical protein
MIFATIPPVLPNENKSVEKMKIAAIQSSGGNQYDNLRASGNVVGKRLTCSLITTSQAGARKGGSL